MTESEAPKKELPAVFLIGEYEKDYESLSLECNDILLSVCKDSMELAYQKWLGMLSDMEVYADEIEFDLKGLKLWMNVYWHSNGSIRHIIYYPKPNSKNMNYDQLSVFFKSFVERYQMILENETCFSHYGSASFPTFAKLYLPKEK
jgi:hypothetical protein